MNRTIGQLLVFLVTAFAVVSCGKVGDAPEAKTGSAVEVAKGAGGMYAIDTARSKVSWKAAKVTKAHDGGFRVFSGTVTVDVDKVTAASIIVDATSIWSDEEKLTGHLRSDDFFSVEKFPTATFEASRFVKADSVQGATHMVTGNLTMRGNTKSITFPANITVNGNEVKATADFKINRKDWQIMYPGAPDDLVSDDVRILFDITAVKSAPSA